MPTLADKVTIVLMTYNSGGQLTTTLERLLPLGLPVIAVDNGSTDDSLQLLQSYPEISLVPLLKNIGAAARNIGVQRAVTPYIAFCDDDSAWNADGLEVAADMLDTFPRLALVNARILVGKDKRLDPISEQMADSPLPDEAGIPGRVLLSFMGGASVVRRTAWLEVGGYDRRFFIGGEEETVGWKLAKKGWQMRYVPEVVAYHFPSLNNVPHLQHYGIRNAIWNAWLNRTLGGAIKRTWHIIRVSPKNRILLRGLLMTVPGIPWILRERQPFSPELERQVGILETQRGKGRRDRRYAADIKPAKPHPPRY